MATKKQLALQIHEWEDFYRNYLSEAPQNDKDTPAEKASRIARLEKNTPEWFKYYFHEYVTSEFAPFHLRAIRRLERNDRHHEVRAWARELSKSSLSMMEIIKLALEGKVKNVLLVSNSFDNAVRLLNPFMLQFEKNARIRADYGEQVTPGQWEEADFTIRAGCSFRALGAGQSPRGAKNENYRPDFLLIDDIDTDKDCRNPDIVKQKWEWIERALIPTLSLSGSYRILFNGNIIAPDSIIQRAIKQAMHVDIVNIRDESGKSTWPAKNSEADIDIFLSTLSYAAQQQEFFNNPIIEGETFKEVTWGRVPRVSDMKFLVAYGDPATANNDKKSSATKAIVLMGYKDGNYYIFKARVDNTVNDNYIQWYFDLRDWIRGRTTVYYYIENNSLMNPFYEQVFVPLINQKIKKQGSLGVTPDPRKKGDKFTRIEGNLEPIVRNGSLIFNQTEKECPHMKRLEQQFLYVTPKLSAPVDGVDAVEGAKFIIDGKIRELNPDSIRVVRYHTNTKRF